MLWAAGRLPTNAPPRTGSAAGPVGPARALGAVHAPSCYFSLLLQHATLSLAVLSLSLIPLTRSSFSCTLSSLAAFFCLTDSLLSAERPPKILIPVQQFFLKLPEHWDFLLPQRLCPGCAPGLLCSPLPKAVPPAAVKANTAPLEDGDALWWFRLCSSFQLLQPQHCTGVPFLLPSSQKFLPEVGHLLPGPMHFPVFWVGCIKTRTQSKNSGTSQIQLDSLGSHGSCGASSTC